MSASIGDCDILSIGQSDARGRHAPRVTARPRRSDLRYTFWQRLQQALEAAGVPKKQRTQVAIAHIAQVKQPTVSGWNKPGGFPEVERGVRIARKFGLCLDWLYSEIGPPLVGEYPSDEKARLLWKLWPDLKEEVKTDILGAARTSLRAETSTTDPPLPEPAIPPASHR